MSGLVGCVSDLLHIWQFVRHRTKTVFMSGGYQGRSRKEWDEICAMATPAEVAEVWVGIHAPVPLISQLSDSSLVPKRNTEPRCHGLPCLFVAGCQSAPSDIQEAVLDAHGANQPVGGHTLVAGILKTPPTVDGGTSTPFLVKDWTSNGTVFLFLEKQLREQAGLSSSPHPAPSTQR